MQTTSSAVAANGRTSKLSACGTWDQGHTQKIIFFLGGRGEGGTDQRSTWAGPVRSEDESFNPGLARPEREVQIWNQVWPGLKQNLQFWTEAKYANLQTTD